MTRTTLLRVVAAVTFAVLVDGAVAADLTLPDETGSLRASPLHGHALAVQKCTVCHSADYVSYQPPTFTLAQWTGEVAKMQKAYGAPLTDDEVRQIGVYLAVAYGSARPTDPAVVAASAGPVPTPTNDPMAAMTASGCLACHAVAQTVVGPAFHDVANRYRGDAQGLAKVSTRIRQGGSGQWSSTPMPPFPDLSDAAIQSIAAYVLAQ